MHGGCAVLHSTKSLCMSAHLVVPATTTCLARMHRHHLPSGQSTTGTSSRAWSCSLLWSPRRQERRAQGFSRIGLRRCELQMTCSRRRLRCKESTRDFDASFRRSSSGLATTHVCADEQCRATNGGVMNTFLNPNRPLLCSASALQ